MMIVKYKALVAYLFFGVCSMIVNIAAYCLCYSICNIGNVFSTIIAWLIAVIFAFITNKMFVFGSRDKSFIGDMTELLCFFICRIITGMIDVSIMWYAVDHMGWSSMLWKFVSNAIVIILNYIASKLLVFK